MSLVHILAFSSSRYRNTEYLETNFPDIKNFIGGKSRLNSLGQAINIAFIPFATADNKYEEYGLHVMDSLKDLPYKIEIVFPQNAKSLIEKCDAIMIGGGNTFKLLHDIYDLNLLDLIRDKVNNGVPYIGWSAGSNILGLTIGTTNDMPIVEPKSFKALGLFPFQINPHYFNIKTEGFNGETRDERLEEFMQMNPGIPIACLPEGSGLKLENDMLKYFGKDQGSLFYNENEETNFIKREIKDGEDLSFLL
ncbi:MAG: dipeptidase PepE [Ginsengibacter sp.]